jgi:hypothetical protein
VYARLRAGDRLIVEVEASTTSHLPSITHTLTAPKHSSTAGQRKK